ncbi:MAG: VapE domain-containing protein [Allomuricauda sp.]
MTTETKKKNTKSAKKKGSSGISQIHLVEAYLQGRYDFRFNEISLNIEMRSLYDNDWKICNDNSLWVELHKNNIPVPITNLRIILRSDFVPRFNPLKHYFQNLNQWDGQTDYIQKYASYVRLAPGEDRGQFFYHFKKWCVRAVKCALIDGYFNKQAFVLSDDGKGQNIGKSTWCRFLCPKELSDYIAEDMGGNDKDSRLLLCKNFLINLDELAALARKEINQLKSQLSKDQINERLPYGSTNTVLQRVASFIGSTNQSTFLMDETGSVRWLCFMVESIDFSYKSEFDMDHLWAQAYYLANDKSFDETMSRSDVNQNEVRNKKFQTMTPEHELLLNYLKKPVNDSDGEYMTATSIVDYIQQITMTKQRLTKVNMGKALNQELFEKKKTGGSTLYLIQKINNQ